MKELLSLCEEESANIQHFYEEFSNGVGQLIRAINNSECDVKKDDVKFQTAKVVDSSRGTFYSVDDGVTHAGCEAWTGCILVMLFWTVQRKGEEPCNSDSQHTVLSLLVQLCVLIWENLLTEEN